MCKPQKRELMAAKYNGFTVCDMGLVKFSNYIYIYIHIIDHMLFYFITGPVERQHMLHWSLNFLFFIICFV